MEATAHTINAKEKYTVGIQIPDMQIPATF